MKKLLLVAGLMFCLAGCSSAPVTVRQELGEISGEEPGRGDVGARRMMSELAAKVASNPDATVFIVHADLKWPSGSVMPVTLNYDRGLHSLTRKGASGPGLAYGNVTDDVIKSTAAAGGMVDDLTQHGAAQR